jgi:hypothetical protein
MARSSKARRSDRCRGLCGVFMTLGRVEYGDGDKRLYRWISICWMACESRWSEYAGFVNGSDWKDVGMAWLALWRVRYVFGIGMANSRV